MRLGRLGRKARFKLIPAEEDISGLLFEHEKTRQASRLFLEWLKKNGGEATRHEVSRFGFDLQARKIAEGFTFRRENSLYIRLADL